MGGKVLVSFDIEEFDLPREHGGEISLKEGVKVSSEGLERILEVLEKQKVKATFFVTGNFARENPEAVRKIFKAGHEVGAHGVDHFCPKASDLEESKKILEKVLGKKISGYRVPRMQEIDYKELKRLGYKYDSSVNPAFIPGRYNHLDVPRKKFKKEGVFEVPTSVATRLRIPMFWLALHLFPLGVFKRLALRSLKETGYFATYFHPWEFTELKKFPVVPVYIKENSGEKLAKRLDSVISFLKKHGGEFFTFGEFIEEV